MLSVSNITVQFGAKKLFEDVSFFVNPRDRIGLVGSNGTGKSTLLKIITGLVEPDSGEIAIVKHTSIDYLPQDGISYRGKTLYDEVYSGVGDIAAVHNELDEIQKELETREDRDSEAYLELVELQGELQHKFEDLDGFKIKASIEKILGGLGFETRDFGRLTDEFSGGWQMRIALAKLLLNKPSVLLLDEPTNHLDIESLLWLEGFLKSYPGSIILVSHDRTFLDNITNKTIEIYTGEVNIYEGNYSYYVVEKEKRRELLEKRFANQQRYLKQQSRFIERFRYKATKASAVQSRIKMMDKLEIIELEDKESEIHFNFPPATHSGKKIIELKCISKSYGENLVLKELDLEIEKGDKIGLIGNNGAGKSTLARIIRGTEEIQSGERKLGFEVELEYYSQHQADTLDPKNTVLGTLDAVATGDIRKRLRTLLGSFLFKGDDVFKTVSVLSGGEKSRLALARMLLRPSNFLVLDEPTNHLDMNSKQVLMRALADYAGTILIISHDREFLDGIVSKIIEVKSMNIRTYIGNCSYYLMKRDEELAGIVNGNSIDSQSGKFSSNQTSNDNSAKEKTKNKKRVEAEARNKFYKISKPVKDKISKIENDIALSEERLKEIEALMESPDFYKDSGNVIKINAEYKELKTKLNNLYHEWMENNKALVKIEAEMNTN